MSAPAKPKKTPAKKAAAKVAKPDADAVEQLIRDANVDTSRFPVMVALHQIGRRERVQLMKASRHIDPSRIGTLIETLQTDGENTDAAIALAEAMADVEDMLVPFAAEPDVFRMWAKTADDAALMVLMAQIVTELGEVPSSSS